MSAAQTSTGIPDPSTLAMKPTVRGSLRVVAFLAIAGLATLAWVGFLIWVVLALLGF